MPRHEPLAFGIPRSEFLKALLLVRIRSAYATGTEAAGRPGGRDQSRDSKNGVGAAGFDAAEAIGPEKAQWLCSGSNTQ